MGFGLLGLGCSDGDDDADPTVAFGLTSPAFSDGQALPSEYTCVGKNFPFSGMPPVDHVSPQLNWTAGPANTQSYAIVFRDMTLTTGATIDERGYHWGIWNIPASVSSLQKALPSGNPIASITGAKQFSGPLFNDGYVGPCPSWSTAPGAPPPMEGAPAPTVKTDSYTFTVYALPTATFTEPPKRVPVEGGPPISYVKDLNDALIAQAIGTAVLDTTSDAQPAMFAVPPPAP